MKKAGMSVEEALRRADAKFEAEKKPDPPDPELYMPAKDLCKQKNVHGRLFVLGTGLMQGEQLKKFRKALAEQKLRRKTEDEPRAPVGLDDRNYRGWCPSLGIYIEGRTHYRRLLKERGLRCLYE